MPKEHALKVAGICLTLLEEKRKSADLAAFLIEFEQIVTDQATRDLLTEIALTASPLEEAGVGCLSMQQLQSRYSTLLAS